MAQIWNHLCVARVTVPVSSVGNPMKFKSIFLGSIILVSAGTSMIARAQGGAPIFKLMLASGSSCDLSIMQLLNLEPSAQGLVLIGNSNPVFLQYATALFNPKEYTLARGASVNNG